MPYTALSVMFVWVVTFALLAVTVITTPSGPWLIVTVVAALIAPALLRRGGFPSRGQRSSGGFGSEGRRDGAASSR